MFKKPKRNFRERKHDDSDEEGVKEDRDGGSSGDAAKKKDNVTPTSQPKLEKSKTIAADKSKAAGGMTSKGSSTVLSFEGEEEDGDIFQIKKSKTSQRVARQLKKESRKERAKDSDSTQSDGVQVEKGVSNGERGAKNEHPPVSSDKRVFKMMKSESESSDSHDDDDNDDNSKGGAPSMQQFLQSGQIPDANLIHLARKKRQQARALGDDFVPIDDTIKFEKGSSRLIRDDDNDRSDDSDEEMLSLTTKQKDAERRKLQEQILMAEEDSGGESDKEGDWEEMQLRKGFCLPAAHQPQQQTDSATTEDGYDYYGSYPVGYTADASSLYTSTDTSSISGGLVPPPPAPPIAIAGGQMIGMEDIKGRLAARLEEMSTRQRVHAHERDDLRSRADLCLSSILKLKEETTQLEKQYQFFQETRAFIRDFTDCMNEKMGSIQYLERCMNELYQKRCEKLIKRRQEDVRDQSMEYTAGKAVVVPGSEDVAKSRRRADREARRARRKRFREKSNVTGHNEGWSTDDEDTSLSEATKFRNERERLAADCATVFDDVVDDFCYYPEVMRRFEEWRRDYGDSYREAYIGMCLTKVFSPLIKLELITWNPLESTCRDFEESSWYQSLMFYGYSSDVASGAADGEDHTNGTESQPPLRDDNDDTLVPSVVEKLLLPRLTTLVVEAWDPMSLQQSRRLTAVIRRLIEEYPSVNAESKNTQALIKAVHTRLTKSVNEDIFVPLYAKQLLENRHSDASIFFHRQTWTTIKLLTSTVLWDGIISSNPLKTLVFDCLLNRYLLIALTNCPIGMELITKCQAIASVLPREWFLACTSDQTLPQLENFCRFLVNTAKQIKSMKSTNPDSRELLRQISKTLVHIYAMNHAMAVSER